MLIKSEVGSFSYRLLHNLTSFPTGGVAPCWLLERIQVQLISALVQVQLSLFYQLEIIKAEKIIRFSTSQ